MVVAGGEYQQDLRYRLKALGEHEAPEPRGPDARAARSIYGRQKAEREISQKENLDGGRRVDGQKVTMTLSTQAIRTLRKKGILAKNSAV